MAAPPPPPPPSLLGRHRLLAPSASVRVSPICLGGMSLGSKWQGLMGDCSKDMAFEILDTFYDLGGNFIDTANVYQGGESEEWIGEWMKKTGRRDEIVLATKYTLGYRSMDGAGIQKSNFGGTGTKSMHVAIESSLKRLQTDYVDLFYVHIWDYATDVAELMQSLNILVQQRKILYLGISDAPAWVVVKANAYARQHGLRPFSVYQGRYSAHVRDLERDILPMCQDERMGVAPWGVLGSGHFRAPDAGPKEGGRQGTFMLTGAESKVSEVLDRVGKKHGVPVTSVAISYVMHKAPYIFPILGGRSVANLKANVEALGLSLSSEEIEEIETGYAFDPGFPHNFIGVGNKLPRGPEEVNILRQLGYFDYVQGPQPTKAHQGDLGAQWKP